MISIYDYIIIGFYLFFMLAIGVVFRRMSKDTSDYFRAGGAMPWWLTGASAWIFSYSAWTFTGAAGKVYEVGTVVLAVYYSTILGLVVAMIWTCVRFRRMRVITWMEAVRARYGPFTEQLYTWIKLPLLFFFSALGLNAIGVFMAAVFNIHMPTVLIVLGLVITLVSFAGGSWAVLASDFVQMLLVVTITICTAAMVLARPEIGGLTGLIHKVPAREFDWSQLARPELVVVWIICNMWFKFSDENNMERASMYLMTRSDRDARKMVMIPLLGTIFGPLIWFIPAMAATVMFPHLAADYPQLQHPHEAAFVAVAMKVMPNGLIGLLLCAMLGATLTSMDAGLNKNVGIFVRSLYKPVFKPHATEKHLLMAGKISTLAFGVIIILLALAINRFRTMGLFDLVNQFAANLLMPLALPLIYGMYIKRTPAWSAWSTALVGGVSAYVLGKVLTPEWLQHLLGWHKALSHEDKIDLLLGATTLGTVGIGTAWYFFTCLFYKGSPVENHERVETFFQKLHTPLDKHHVEGVQTSVYRLLGTLCVVYGIFILLLMLIPNRFDGRLAFLFCGGIVFGVGALILLAAKRKAREAKADAANTEAVAPEMD